MSFEQVPMVRVICDGCRISAQDGVEYAAWADEEEAQYDAEDAGWLIPGDGTHWCHGCTVWDEDRDWTPRTGPGAGGRGRREPPRACPRDAAGHSSRHGAAPGHFPPVSGAAPLHP